MVEKLRPFINGNYVESKTDKYSDIYDPSTGEVIAQAPICTHQEVEAAVRAAAVPLQPVLLPQPRPLT